MTNEFIKIRKFKLLYFKPTKEPKECSPLARKMPAGGWSRSWLLLGFAIPDQKYNTGIRYFFKRCTGIPVLGIFKNLQKNVSQCSAKLAGKD